MSDAPDRGAAETVARAEELLAFVDQQVAHMLRLARHAVATFFAEADAEHLAALRAEDEAAIVPTDRDLERFAARWQRLVPPDPGVRAALGRAIGQRGGLTYAAVPGIRAALSLDDAATVAAYRALFDGDPADVFLADESGPELAPRSAIEAVEGDLEWVSLRGGEVLFAQGDPGDALFIVVNGRLRAVLEAPDGTRRTLSDMGRGEMVGEIAVITGQPRTATVEASRDTELVRLSKESFDRLVEIYPAGVMQIARMLVLRLQRQSTLPRRATTPLSTIALIAGGGGAPLGPFAERLVGALARWGPTLHLDAARLDAELGPGAAHGTADTLDHSRIVAWLSRQESHFRYVVYQADADPSPWTEQCIRQADRVLVVADADGDPGLHPVEHTLVRTVSDMAAPPRQDLVLLQRRRDRLPRGTAAWLASRAPAAHYHVCLDAPDDFARLARRLTGRAIGLALSGGGSRGNVYIGVLRAMRELGIPIDVVGGTSVGSLFAAEIALEWDDRKIYEVTRRHTVDKPARPSFTLPLVALSTGAGMSETLRTVFGDTEVEDLWLPFFAVATDLTAGDVRVLDRGKVAGAIRASVSVPGMFPPVTENGHLLIDGGPLNNLPSDVVGRICDGGKVIAVNCNPRLGIEAPWEYGETLRARDIVWNSLLPWGKRRPFPNIGAILERTTMVSSVRQASEVISVTADLYLHPPTDDFSLFDPSTYDRAIEVGYQYSRDLLAAWKERAFGPEGP